MANLSLTFPFLLLLVLTLFSSSSSDFVSNPEVLTPSPPLEHPPPLHHPPAVAPALPPSQHHHHPHHPHAPNPSPSHSPAPFHGHHPHHHSHAHSPAPAPTPTYHGPRPALPPFRPMERRFIAVQGVVYCKSCKYAGADTLLGASPLLGAVVKLECNNTKLRPSTQVAKTDKNGYFYLEAPKTVTSYAFHKCKAYLVSSPLATCSKASLLHGGSTGASLRPDKPFMAQKLPFILYTVGPLAFEPQCPH
ncbi:hypothetical protein MLD38_039892 [Melastoma candidum]|uniref:Uncharacterized protein n=1 Tax=Melastoma candidum TaxID=119954 RepID=A0ACB9L556_9MYRT|nr:hypothetical protein MLD38_039892 [Melastoma candidum]